MTKVSALTWVGASAAESAAAGAAAGIHGLRSWAIGLTLAVCACSAHAEPNARPLSLDVKGKISKTTDAAHQLYHFGEAELLALPVHSITTATTWTPRSTFTGPLLDDILKTVGARGSEIEVRTLDDYTYTIPVSDGARYGVVMAYSMNGQRLKISDFGPLFLIYPRDAFPDELVGTVGDSKFVWQIKALIVK
ncbi:molybdopterin-dependent oxidoreductase [Paraburkholderia sp. BCC1886]|uniref:molybdopterin-dependent oxidoreductase n=1 Tax=Paraburkholderia sp. BCC1886 TaxID=2562670 RepID=UPI001182C5AB|nr:molybdopterin-dependent oxidoreductase [Paraburkholderia sp. BCC1886]